MNILILNPPSTHTLLEFPDENNESYIETEDFGFFPPLGALYVLSFLEKNTTGHNLFFKDCVAEKISHEDLKTVVEKIKPDVVGITSFTISLVDVITAARNIRSVSPRAHICLGGHHPIAFPFQAAELPEFDSIVVGEGEEAFTELVKKIELNADFTGIPGVYTRQSIKKFKDTPYRDKHFLPNVVVPPAYINEINSLPVPNRTYITHIGYQSTLGVSGHLATIITSRGCPYRCIYCDVPYKKYRERSISHVVDEIEECLRLGYKEFHFYDDLFNITPEKVIAFCDEVERRNLLFHWDFRGRVNTVTEESIIRAKKAGCRMISFGVETGSDEGLKFLKKGTTTERITEAFRLCRRHGIKTMANFIIGQPYEKTEDDIRNNLRFLVKIDPDYILINILMLFPNTEMYDLALLRKVVTPGAWEEFSLHPTTKFAIDHWEEFMPLKKLVALQREGYRKFYLRPRYILRNILSTRSWYEFKAKAKGFLKLLF